MGSVHSLVGTGLMIRGSHSDRRKNWQSIKSVLEVFSPHLKKPGCEVNQSPHLEPGLMNRSGFLLPLYVPIL